MKNPLHKKMPLWLDIKIRMRLLLAVLSKYKKSTVFVGGLFAAPALAALLLFVQTDSNLNNNDTLALVTSIREAQAAEIERSAEGIYHVKRVIEEGSGKSGYVAKILGEELSTEARTDIIETWQHNDTALALINSNETESSFEAFLSIEHDGKLAMHHFGLKDQDVTSERLAYDEVHNLSSLYTEYKSLETPKVAVLPEGADFVELDTKNKVALFTYSPSEGLQVEYEVDLDSKLVVAEIIYVLDDTGARFEMTRTAYLERTVVPASSFDEIFNPEQFAYQAV
jgi:hypothetical protein